MERLQKNYKIMGNQTLALSITALLAYFAYFAYFACYRVYYSFIHMRHPPRLRLPEPLPKSWRMADQLDPIPPLG
jgi:hypothetical protein